MYPYLFILFLAVGECFGQSSSKIDATEFSNLMSPVLDKLNQNNIVMKFKKETFSDPKSTSPIESLSGVIYRGTGLNYKMTAGGITVLQTDELAIYIDSAQQFVQVSDIDSSLKAMNMVGTFSDKMLASYELEKTITESSLILKATPKFFDEGILEFYIDPKKKSLYKFVISLPPGNYFSEQEDDETIESPYVTVIYEPITLLKKNEVSFSETAILIKDKQDNLSLTPTMAGYQLHDSRYRSKK